jgi:myosin heavy subunit
VSDLTLISKVTNEAINDNLKIRFENGEIYVCALTRYGKVWEEYVC